MVLAKRTKKPTYSSGPVTLYRGDCLEVLAAMPADSIDAVVTDPPYCNRNLWATQRTRGDWGIGLRRLSFDWDRLPDGYMESRLDAAIGRSSCKATFIFCGLRQTQTICDLLSRHGFTPKPFAWVKKCPPPAGKGNWWPSAFELAIYAYRPGAWFGDRDPKRSNVVVCDTYRHGQPGKVGHPTQKPLSLMEKIVASICPPDGLILDPFMGSGSTGEACLRLGRRFIGIEKDAHWFNVARRRLQAAIRGGGP